MEIDRKGKKKIFPEEEEQQATEVVVQGNTAIIMKKEMLSEDEEQLNKQRAMEVDRKGKKKMFPEEEEEPATEVIEGNTAIVKKKMLPEDEEQVVVNKQRADSVVVVADSNKYIRWAKNCNETRFFDFSRELEGKIIAVKSEKSKHLHMRCHSYEQRRSKTMLTTTTARNNSSPSCNISAAIVDMSPPSLVKDDKIDSVPVDTAITDLCCRPILSEVVEKHSWSIKAKRSRHRDLTRTKDHQTGYQPQTHPHHVENSHGKDDDQNLPKKMKRVDELETDDDNTDFTSITSKKQIIDESAVENKKMELDEVEQKEATSVRGRSGLDEKEVVNMVSSGGEFKAESTRTETKNSNQSMLLHDALGTELLLKSKEHAVYEAEGTSMFGLKQKEAVSSYDNQHTCTICNKSFSSHQALGGHRSSHCIKKIKDGAAVVQEGDQSLIVSNSITKVGSHKCDQCDKSFPTGQALGGHKRRHFNGTMMIGAPIRSISSLDTTGGNYLSLRGPVKEFSIGNKSFPRRQALEGHETHQSVASVPNEAPIPATSSSQEHNLSETGHGKMIDLHCKESFLIDQAPRTHNNMALLPEATKLPTSATISLATRDENDHSQAGGQEIALAFDLNEMPAAMEGEEGDDLGTSTDASCSYHH